MKIYFAGSIRGGRGDAVTYQEIIAMLKDYGEVLTEHVGDTKLSSYGEPMPEQEIFTRDMEWLSSTDVVVAEVSTPSLGVGYELGRAESMGKRVLCLYRSYGKRSLSAMLAGNPKFSVVEYSDVADLKEILKEFLVGSS